MTTPPRRLALITGASSGIGAALARVYAEHGWDVALTARRGERLEQVADELRARFGVLALTRAADLADPATPQALADWLADEARPASALVNNAGFSRTSGFAETPLGDHGAMLRVMLQAPIELTHLLLPAMLEQRFGRVLNVCSLAGLLPATGGDTLYGPIKSFLIRASQGLHLELRDRGVHVSALCPGYVYSEFHDANGSREAVTRAYPHWMWMNAGAVAREGYEAVEANRPMSVPGAPNKAIAALVKLLPDDWTLALADRHAGRLGRL